MPFAKELTVNGSFRYTDYDSYGDDTTYKAGLVYRPIDWVTLRATYGTSYRAPALFEQFVGASTGFQASNFDRCDNLASKDKATDVFNFAQGMFVTFGAFFAVTTITSLGLPFPIAVAAIILASAAKPLAQSCLNA